MLPHRNFSAAVFSFNIGWDALGPGLMIAVDTEEFDRNGAGIFFCTGVAVIQGIIETCVTEDDHSIGFGCFHYCGKRRPRGKFPCVSPVR